MIFKTEDAAQFAAVLPAGGLGKRMGTALPKQLLELQGRPLWRYSLECFLAHPRIGCVVLVVPADWRSHFEAALGDLPVIVTTGGVERWQSVQNGIAALPSSVRYALVHDVARPFLSPAIIAAVLDQVERSACIVARPVHDTVKYVENGVITSTIDRSKVWLAQTPQAFSVAIMRELYSRIAEQELPFVPTDEASLLEYFQVPVAVVPGDTWNDKVTTPEDFERFRVALQAQGR